MAGRGPAPKDPSRRARGNKDPIPLRVIHADPVEQPELPSFYVEDDGLLVAFEWPAVTREWWQMWKNEPISADFRPTDWAFLADTALIHAAVWARGDLKQLPELRLRVAKMAATMEDRARLRITYAAAEEADEKRQRRSVTSDARKRRGPLTGT